MQRAADHATGRGISTRSSGYNGIKASITACKGYALTTLIMAGPSDDEEDLVARIGSCKGYFGPLCRGCDPPPSRRPGKKGEFW